MNKNFLLLFLVLFIFFIYSKYFFGSITGFIAEFVSLNLNIKSNTEGKFIYFSYPYVIYLMNRNGEIVLTQNATFNVTFMNTGNLDITGRIVIYVKNSTFDTLATYYDDDFYLSPLDIKNFSTTFIPNTTGTYWVIANATYNSTTENKIEVENKTFDVINGLIIRLTVSANTNSYCPNDTIYVTTKLENIGYFNITGNLSSRITDPWKNIKKEENWLYIDLPVNETKYFFMNYTVQNNDTMGDYRVTSDFNYYDYYNSSTIGLKIKSSEGILLTSPSWIERTIYIGQSATQNLHMWLDYACVDTVARLNKSSGNPGDWITFSQNELFLGSNGYLNTTILNIKVPIDTEEGTYIGTIYVNTEKQNKEIPLIIHVGTFNITSIVQFFPGQEGDICLGDTLLANVTIVTGYSEITDVNVTYRILDSHSMIVTEWSETLEINNILQKNVTFTIPITGPEGYYTFMIIVQYGSIIDQSSMTFKVNSCITPTTVPEILGGTGISGGIKGAFLPVIPTLPTSYNLTLILSTNILTALLGNETSFFAYVKNDGHETVNSVRISVDRIPPDWVRVSPSYSDISPNGTQAYLVVIKIPKNSPIRVYKLKVKATDKVESNTETLTLVIGQNLKEVADNLLKELKDIMTKAKESVSIDCVNTTLLKKLQEDAELALENGMKEYENNNYEKAINWFEYAITIEEKVINLVDIMFRIEIENLGLSDILFPIKLEFNKEQLFANNNIDAKEYKIICESIIKMRNLIKVALAFWFLIFLFILLIIILFKLKRKKKEVEELKLPKLRLESAA